MSVDRYICRSQKNLNLEKMEEQKRLQITGISALLPPSVSPDGECSHVVNLRCRDDVWRPVGTPSCCYTPADPSHRLIFVHVNESYKHFFTYDDSFLYYEAQETDGEIVPLERPESFELTGVKRMEAVGNALIAFAEDSMHYLFYIDGSYRLLGTRPEFPEISFSLREKTIREELWSDYALVAPTSDDASFTLSDNDKVRFSSLVYGTYSRAKSALLDDGYLSFPFMVRYALRLYDDSYIYPSPPVLLCGSDALSFNNNLAAMCRVKDGNVEKFLHNPFSLSGEKVYYTIKKADLSEWSDVVKGIDIFFSKELPLVKEGAIEDNYRIVEEDDVNGNPARVLRFSLPVLPDDEQREQIISETLFYKVASLDIEDIKGDSQTPEPLAYTCSLSNLIHQRTLLLDNFSLHTLRAKESYVYNGRLHLGDVTTRFFDGYPLSLFSVAQETYHGVAMPAYTKRGFVRVSLKGTMGQSQMILPFETDTYKLSAYLSYPDSRAVSIEIIGMTTSGSPNYYDRFPLKAAPNENMAYYLNPGFNPITLHPIQSSMGGTLFPEVKNPEEYVPGKLRVSAVYNPFSFPQINTYTISSGSVLGMAAATAALSQGQYGEFPLYVFTTDGIWALRQGSGDILYASQSPVNREVALSPRHIVSVDDAVLYLSEQGLMALQGSDVVLLSRPFDGLPDTLPGDTVSVLDTGLSITSIAVDATPFGNFVKNAVIGYNYIEKELLFLSPGYPYMWVFDLASAQWTRRMTTYKAFHSLYPSLLAIDEDSRVYDLCDEQESGDVEIALVTRAVKLLPDVLKRITCWALRCSDDDAALSLSVWGANRAQEGYGCIYRAEANGALPGRLLLRTFAPPYKYHRLSVSGRVSSRFHLDAVDVVYEPVLSCKLI